MEHHCCFVVAVLVAVDVVIVAVLVVRMLL